MFRYHCFIPKTGQYRTGKTPAEIGFSADDPFFENRFEFSKDFECGGERMILIKELISSVAVIERGKSFATCTYVELKDAIDYVPPEPGEYVMLIPMDSFEVQEVTRRERVK